MTASREVRCLAECCMRLSRGSIRLSRAAAPRAFLTGNLWGSIRRRLIQHFRNGCHPLVGETPLQRTGAPCLPLPLGRDAFHGVAWSLFATSIELVLATEFHLRHLSVLGVSDALDGLHRARPAGCISTRRHVQGSPFRGFSLSLGRTSSSLADALLAFRSGALSTVAHRHHEPERRLQGFAPHENPPSDATGFSHCVSDDPPLGFFLLQVLSPHIANRLGRLRRS